MKLFSTGTPIDHQVAELRDNYPDLIHNQVLLVCYTYYKLLPMRHPLPVSRALVFYRSCILM